VQAVEIDLFPAAAVFAGAAWWPLAVAAPIAAEWHRWTLEAPPQITTALRITPQGVCVDGAVLASVVGESMAAVRIGTELLNRLRAVAPPERDSWELGQPAAAVRDPAGSAAAIGDHLMLREFGSAGTDEIVRAASMLDVVELRQLGGAFAVPHRAGGVFDRTDAGFVYRGAGTPGALARVRRSLSAWALTVERPRLLSVIRDRVDPERVFGDEMAAPGRLG
jgi:hypothetical protein